ncbi:MAG: hypothetical protein AAF135_07465 [Bacteroidota bacterium]
MHPCLIPLFSLVLTTFLLFSQNPLQAQIPRTYPSDVVAQSDGVVTVNIDTHINDDWEFSGNVNMGRATLRERRRQPATTVFRVADGQETRLARAMRHMRPPAVPLTAFTATRFMQGLEISWSTEAQKEIKSFTLERSFDQQTWIEVQQFAPLDKTQGLLRFHMIDKDIHKGSNFYRIRKNNQAGTQAYSNIIAVEVLPTSTHTTFLFPNPVVFGTTIELDLRQASRVTIGLRNSDHSLVAKIYSQYTSIGKHIIELDMANLPQGDYLCEIKVGNDIAYREIRK